MYVPPHRPLPSLHIPAFLATAYGRPTVVLAAIYAALAATGGALKDQTFVLVGESPRLTAIAELLEEAVQREHGRGTVLEARKNIYMVDKQVGEGQEGWVGWKV